MRITGRTLTIAVATSLAAAAGLGGGMYLERATAPVGDGPDIPVTSDSTPPTPDTSAATASAEPDIADQAAPGTPEAPAHDVPSIDVVRVDPDGTALVAGSAPAGGKVTLRLDGGEVSSAEVDPEGNFVSFFDLQSTGKAGLLTLESETSDGTILQARDSIIVAPPAAKVTAEMQGDETADEATAKAGGKVAGATATAAAEEGPAAAAPAPEATASVADPIAAPQMAATAPAGPADGDPAADPGIRTASSAEPASPRLFRAGPDGVTVLSDPGAPPDVSETLGIDAIAYDADGEVQLTGRAAGDSEIRIYLDNEAVRTVRVGKGGSWASPLPNVETGVYTLRIDALDDQGQVASRIETPFERTAPELAAAARQSGVTAITVQPGFTLWAISQGYFGDGLSYVQIFEANREIIRNPDLIYPGQVVTLPVPETALAVQEPRP